MRAAPAWAVLDDRTDGDYGLSTDGHWHEVPFTAVHSETMRLRYFKLALGVAATLRLAVTHAH